MCGDSHQSLIKLLMSSAVYQFIIHENTQSHPAWSKRGHVLELNAGKGYKDSDFTLVIAIMQWHKRIIIVQKLTLMVGLWALLSPRCPPSLVCTIQLSSAVKLSGKAHEDSVHIVVIAVMYWCLRVETHTCGHVVSAVMMFCLRFGCCGSINWTAWSTRDTCVSWNEP